jgi:hypothetical protein
MKKIKNSKFKNTGFLFELLTRQITLEILNGGTDEIAKGIVQEFFGPKSELAKELKLYNLLIHERYNTQSKAEKFIDNVVEARTYLNENKLGREKYNLVKAIKESFDINQFFSSPVNNYKLLASIHKVFESKKYNVLNVKDVFDSKCTLIEHIATSTSDKDTKTSRLIETYKEQDEDVRLLTYKILMETFNKKYTNLSSKQKNLLREYINNVNNTSKFGDYYRSELKSVVSELTNLHNEIDDKVTKIKLKETVNVLKKQKLGKRKITDEQVSALMISYELLREIKNARKQEIS